MNDLDKANRKINELSKNLNDLQVKYDKLNSEKTTCEISCNKLVEQFSTVDKKK